MNHSECSAQQSPGNRTFWPEIALLTTITLWSSTFIVTKDQLDVFSPRAFIFVRFLLMIGMAFGILVVVSRRQKMRVVPSRPDLGRYVLAGLTGYTLYQLGFVFSLDRTSAFASSLLISTVPLWTLLLLTVIGEPPPARSWIGVGIAFFGVAVFLLDREGGDRSLDGDLLALGAALSFAAYGIVNRPLIQKDPYVTNSAFTMLFGGIPLILLSLSQGINHDWSSTDGVHWLGVIYMVIFPVYVAYILWNFGIARRGAAVASSFGMLTPVFAGILSAIIFRERFSAVELVGAALVLAGLLFLRGGSIRKRHRP